MKKKGNVSYYLIIILICIVPIVFILTSILESGYKLTNNTIFSQQAYYNAKAGIIKANAYINQLNNNKIQKYNDIIKLDENSYVEIKIEYIKLENRYRITSIGRYGKFTEEISLNVRCN